MNSTNDLEKLIETLPVFLQKPLKTHVNKDQLIEIILDLGKRPEARFVHGPEYLSSKILSWQDLDFITKQISKFSNENRAGIERTLHRISCIRNRQFLIIGLTCRVGRAIFGTISGLRDLLELNKSILFLGKPGIGKTTIIREIGRILADEMEKRVIIIDTSNEIAGDSDISHPAIGRARRMQVSKTEFQHKIMIEAVENHMPEVIIIDEIGTELEVLAAQTIAEKGVQLVGTTHGNCIENLVKNPSLSDLIGGIQYVTLSDEEAKRRGTNKSVLERKTYPTFEILVEINDLNFWTVHEDVKMDVDFLLQNEFLISQTRQFTQTDKIEIRYNNLKNYSSLVSKQRQDRTDLISSMKNNWNMINNKENSKIYQLSSQSIRIYAYSISRNFLTESFLKFNRNISLTKDINTANIIIGLKKHLKNNLQLKNLAANKKIPIYSFNQISLYQLAKFINSVS